MPVFALLLVLTAAVLHAIWNLLAKDAHDASAFMWWGVTVGAVWFGALMATQAWLGLPQQAWIPFAVSMVAELVYLAAITRGYASGDLSQVYPIARGTPPLFIALASAILLSERLSTLGYMGIGLLFLGVYLASLPSLNDFFRPLRALSHRPAQWGLLAAISVAFYTTLDKIGVSYTAPLVYNFWIYAALAVLYAPFVWKRDCRHSSMNEWKTNWRRIIVGSVATISSYVLALTGLSLTSASYVGAVRATSVVIGAVFGWVLLREKLGLLRVVAAGIMVVGLGMIAVA